MDRRQLIVSAGTVITGGTAAALFTQETSGQLSTAINGLDIPDESIESNTPIKDINLSVDASYSYETTVIPDRIVLRLEAKTSGRYRQVDATEIQATTQADSGSKTLSGSLKSLSGLDSLVPSERGTENKEDIDIRLLFEVSHNGRQIGKADAQDTVTITASKTSLDLSASVGGDGDIAIVTETPT